MKTPVRTFHPPVRLKQLLAEDRGIKVSQAVQRAEAGVESIRDRCMEGVDEKIERLLVLGGAGGADAIDQCYHLANEVYAEAGAFGLKELSAAAHSLCTLLATFDENQVPQSAIKVHVDAMRALRRPEVAGNAALRTAVITELRTLAARFGTPAKTGTNG